MITVCCPDENVAPLSSYNENDRDTCQMQEMINSDKDPTLEGCKERINYFFVFFPSLNSSINVTKRNFITHS